MKKLIQKCNVLIFVTPWDEFRKINNFKKLILKKKSIIIDPLRITKLDDLDKDKYFTIGK